MSQALRSESRWPHGAAQRSFQLLRGTGERGHLGDAGSVLRGLVGKSGSPFRKVSLTAVYSWKAVNYKGFTPAGGPDAAPFGGRSSSDLL